MPPGVGPAASSTRGLNRRVSVPDPTRPTTPPNDPLDELIAIYLQRVEAGEVPDRDALLAEHPDLADRLCAFFADYDRLDRRSGPHPRPDRTHRRVAARSLLRRLRAARRDRAGGHGRRL